MRRLLATSALAVFALALAADTAFAAPQDANVGDVRSALSSRGVRVLQQPKTLGGTVVRVLPYGTRMRVLEKRGTAWFRVQTLDASPVQGWVKMNQTINAYALSGPGRAGAQAAAAQAAVPGEQAALGRGLNTSRANRSGVVSGLSRTEQAAAGRGFENTETHRKSSAQVGRAYVQLDRITRIVVPQARVQRFIRQGGLGR